MHMWKLENLKSMYLLYYVIKKTQKTMKMTIMQKSLWLTNE